MSATSSQTRRAWWITIVVGMASFLDAAAIVATGTALVLLQDEFALSAEAIGQLSALLTVMIAIGAVVGGNLGDRFGRRRVFTITLVIYALGALVLATAIAPAMLYAGLILLGFACGADLPVSIAMIGESAPEGQRGKFVSFTHILWVGGVLAVQAMGVFVGDLGAAGGRILYGVLFVISIIVIILRARLPESAEWQQANETRSTAISQAAQHEVKAAAVGPVRALLTSRYKVPLIAVGLYFAISNIAANTNGQFNTFLWVNVADSTVSLASAVSLGQTILGIGVLWVVTRIVDTKYRMVGFGIGAMFIVAAAAIPALFGVSVPTLVALAILSAFGMNLAGEPIFKVWAQELFPTLHRGTAQGLMIGFTRLVAAAAALATPALAVAGPQILFTFIAVLSLIACLIGLFWIPRISLPDTDDAADTARRLTSEQKA
jgi:inositol transporter-like SP family MFS transporter